MKNMKWVAAMMVSSFMTFQAQAQSAWTLNLDQGSGSVEFIAVGKPAMMKINGKGGKATGQFHLQNGKVTGKAKFDLKQLKTGMDLRDTHMKEKYLEVARFPEATLEITSIQLKNPSAQGDFTDQAPFKGILMIKGESKPVEGVAQLRKSGDQLTGKVEFTTSIQGFNIGVPRFAGITVADELKIKVEFKSPMTAKPGSQKIAGK